MGRRSMAWGLLAALWLPGAVGAAGPPVDVYLIAGQSNATGQGRISNLPAGFAPDPRVWLFHSSFLHSGGDSFAWISLRAASETVEKFGPELTFGARMQELTRDRPVALIKHAMPSSTLGEDWKPGKDASDRAHWGLQFAALVATVEAGMRGMRDRGFEPTIRGMIWQQGESDTMTEELARDYAANLRHFIARVREQFARPDMAFVYGFVLSPPCQLPRRETIRTAQGAIDQDSGSPLAVPNAFAVFTDDLPHRADDRGTTDPGDYLHLGTVGVLELGRRMAETMARQVKASR